MKKQVEEHKFGDLFQGRVHVFDGFPFPLTGGEYVLMHSGLPAPCLEQRCDENPNNNRTGSAAVMRQRGCDAKPSEYCKRPYLHRYGK